MGRRIGHLRAKCPSWHKTMNHNQSGFKLDQDHGRLHLSKIGDIRIRIGPVRIRAEARNLDLIASAYHKHLILIRTRPQNTSQGSRSHQSNPDACIVTSMRHYYNASRNILIAGNNKSMHRDIHDAFWSRFMFMLSYEAECAGRRLIKSHEHHSKVFCLWKHCRKHP
ncbi:hypothetical protein Mthe_0345 [Methanothrix thermoacetophila PT]|uniref:Uncharacterized protein n=1 Tax=Methanothrix thermoacetophila (strain DSM 6194 / JCM 14653 / NBRC 101360 / PT) TaxID=349307 RepID=A0B615_METTP|nr:hypothetical protein Mthe_0345 [Methanothrix thermoacetophila PT]